MAIDNRLGGFAKQGYMEAAQAPDRHVRLGDDVFFHEEGGPYTAKVTKVHALVGGDGTPLVDLATFGSRSLYFQERVQFSEQRFKGTWSWSS